MAPRKVLVVLTSHSKLGDTGKETGWYLPEFAHPYDEFVAAGFEVVVASPQGGAAPLDPSSVENFKNDPSSAAFLLTKPLLWENTIKLSTLAGSPEAVAKTAAEYDALFYPGGHGPMFDLAVDAESHALINGFVAAGKVVSAVCHGPAALANVKLPDGSFLVAGKTISAFTDSEEAAVGLIKAVPFLLETRLREVGATVERVDDWQAKTVVDGKIITGQNPASAKGVGEAIVKAIQ